MNNRQLIDRNEQESLFDYWQRLILLRKALKEEHIKAKKDGQKQKQDEIDQINIKLNDIKKAVNYADIQFVEGSINDLPVCNRDIIYLNRDGEYHLLYKDKIFTGFLLDEKNDHLEFAMEGFPENINDCDFRAFVLDIVSSKIIFTKKSFMDWQKAQYIPKKDILTLKKEEEKFLKPQSNTITVGFSYPMKNPHTIFGCSSAGHVSVRINQENDIYKSLRSSKNSDRSELSKVLHIPDYQSTLGRYEERVEDLVTYINDDEEYQEVVFDCNKTCSLDIQHAVNWANNLPDVPSFNFYDDNCSQMTLKCLLEAGAGQYATKNGYFISPKDVFTFAKAVESKLNALNEEVTTVDDMLERLIGKNDEPTNSDGLKKMRQLRDLNLENCKAIIDKRGSVREKYAHSHFFGSGRKKWVDQFYAFLRAGQFDDENLVKKKLAEMLVNKKCEIGEECKRNEVMGSYYAFR